MPDYTPPPGATLNEYGKWIMPNGDFAPGQDQTSMMAGATPAQAKATGGAVQTEAGTGKLYRIIDGAKWYLPPASGPEDPGGGLIHGRSQWNPQTGAYDTPLDWGKILSMVSAGIVTAGVADAILSSTPALAATAPEGASASASTAASASVLPSTTTAAGSAALPTGLESSMLGTAAVPTAAGGAGLTAVEGLPAGMSDSALASMGTSGVLPEVAGDSTIAGTGLSAADYATDANGVVTDAANVPPDAGGLGSTLGKLGKGLGTLSSLAGEVGQGIGKANTAAGNNRLTQEQLGLTANGQNINGQSAFEQELMNRAKLDASQRSQAMKDSYRNSYASNPRVSPFDVVGAPKLSAAYRGTLANVGAQGDAKLATASPYDSSSLPALTPYKPISPADVQGATNTQQGTLSKAGDWIGPGLTTAQRILQLWGQ